jgi:hydroxypyruvate isomerase
LIILVRPLAKAADSLALVAAVDSLPLRLMLDIQAQVADVPRRCEPGTGEINYSRIAQALRAIGYQGTVGLEAWASGDSELALERFLTAFTKDPHRLDETDVGRACRCALRQAQGAFR